MIGAPNKRWRAFSVHLFYARHGLGHFKMPIEKVRVLLAIAGLHQMQLYAIDHFCDIEWLQQYARDVLRRLRLSLQLCAQLLKFDDKHGQINSIY